MKPTQSLTALGEKVRSLYERKKNIDEANTKRTLITPLLLSLGWDVFGDDVEEELPVQVGSKTENVDYALLIAGKPRVLIEAKRFLREMTKNDEKQAISYAVLKGVKWCALTNGRVLKIYNTKWGRDPDRCKFCEVDLAGLPEGENEVMLLSKSSVAEGELDKASGERRLDIRVRQLLKEHEDEITKKAIQVARNMIYPTLRREMTRVKRQDVDEVISPALRIVLQEKPGPVRPPITEARTPRTKLKRSPPGTVVICPSKPSGVDWMKKHYAWGYVRVRRIPDYFALYVSAPHKAIQYFAEVKDVIEPDDPDSPVRDSFRDDESCDAGKMVILLKKGTLKKLDKEIPHGKDKRKTVRGHRYVHISEFRKAGSLDDL